MRKLLLAAGFLVFAGAASAQDLKDVQEKISKGKYDEAKEKLDKFMADPKNANNANAYYWKGKINTYYAQADTTGSLTYDAAGDAFNAYKKTLELEPKNVSMTLDQHMGLFQLFDMHYNRGIKSYNNKEYDIALTSFQKAVNVQDYIKQKNFSLTNYAPPALDTQLINLTATSAYMAKKEEVAVPYFERLTNAGIATPEYKEVYALVAQYYLNKEDLANATKYLNKGRELYKDDDYWLSLEFNTPELRGYDKQVSALRSQVDKATGTEKTSLEKQMDELQAKQKVAKIKRYDEMLQRYPNNGPLALDYSIELFNNTYIWDKKPADYTDRQMRLQAVLDKSLAANPNDGLGWFIASQHYYSQIFDLEDAKRPLTGKTPAVTAKLKDINTQIDKKYEDMMMASQKAFDIYAAMPELKQQDKGNYRKTMDQLVDYYTRKKMADKVTFYQNKKAAIK